MPHQYDPLCPHCLCRIDDPKAPSDNARVLVTRWLAKQEGMISPERMSDADILSSDRPSLTILRAQADELLALLANAA